MIRPTEITERSIELKGVCERFLDAVDEQRAEDRASRRQFERDNYDDRERHRERDRPRSRQDDDRFREEHRRDDYEY